MRILVVAALAISVSGCATFPDIKGAIQTITTPVTITMQMVYDAESGMKAAAAGLVGYRRLCIKKVIDPVTRNCRKVIESIQPYTRSAEAILPELRASVKANDQKTAIDAYRHLRSIIDAVQAERKKAGV